MNQDETIRKHYELQQTALNEISELIALQDEKGLSSGELVEAIDLITGYAAQVDLFNPHTKPEDLQFLSTYNPNVDVLIQAREKFRDRR